MSKEATIIQSFNDVKRQYEYFVKGYDVTESVEILLKRHKEAYDKEKKVFAGIDGYLEAQKEYQSQIADLQSQLIEKDREIKYYESEWKDCQQKLDHYIGECLNLKDEQKSGDGRMSEHYGICARCIKNLVIKKSDDYYFSEIDGEILCQECWQKEQPKELSKQIVKLQSQLAEKEKEIERLKKEIKEPEEIWNANLAELKEEVKQKLAQEFTEKIDGMLKEKVKEKTIDLNNQIRLMQESQQIEIDKRQREVNGYLKVIRAYNSNENQKAIDQLEKVNEVLTGTIIEVTEDEFDPDKLCYLEEISARFHDKMQQQINELKGKTQE